jgi:glycosyltransferase involved in cell wall biosynthesis
MRIIVHIGNYDKNACDGVATTISGQVDALYRLGVAVEVWSFSHEVTIPTLQTTEAGAPHWLIPNIKSSYLGLFKLSVITKNWIRKRQPEIALFHLHSVFSPTNNHIANLGTRYMVTPHGGWSDKVIKGRNRIAKWLWIQIYEKRLWSRASAIQSVSEPEMIDLKSLRNISTIRYIQNGMDTPSKSNLNHTINEKVWLFMGRLAIEQKGLDRLIESYAMSLSHDPKTPNLVIAGPDFRDGKQWLEKRIQELKLEHKITILGPVIGKEKSTLLRNTCLFIHTSRWEGMPLSILEAMAHGIPCLVTKGTNVNQLITQHHAGYDCGESTEEIAAAMKKAANENLESMGMNARKVIQHHFSWKSIAEQLRDLYQSLS